MSRVIKNFTKNFTIADNRVAQCTALDLNAKGLYLYIASLPDDWEFSIERIARANQTTEGKVKSAIKQLEQVGLLKRHYELNSNGKRGIRADYEIFDFDTKTPRTEDSLIKISTPKNLMTEKVGVYINNKDTKKESYKEKNLQNPPLSPQNENECKSESENSPLKAIRENFEKLKALYKQVKPSMNDLLFQRAEQEFFRIARDSVCSAPEIVEAMRKQVELWNHKLKEDAKSIKYIPRLENWLERRAFFEDFDNLLEPYRRKGNQQARGSIDYGDPEAEDGYLFEILKKVKNK